MVINKKHYGVSDMVKIPFMCSPILTLLVIIQQIVLGLLPTLQVVVTARFIDTAISIIQHQTAMSRIYPYIAAIVGIIAFTWVSGELMKFVHVKLEIRLREQFRTAIVHKRARLAYKHIENHETYDIISRVSASPESKLLGAYYNLLSICSMVIQIAGLLFLLIVHVWWAALLITAISIPLLQVAIKSGKANYEANREVSKYKRRYEYLHWVLSGRETVDERAMFGFSEKLNETWHDQYETARKIEYRTELKWYVRMKLGSVITALISVIIIFILLNPVLSGVLSIGMFIALVNAVFGLAGMMSWSLAHKVDQFAIHREYLKDLTAFAKLEEVEGGEALPALPSPAFHSLVFESVSFRYPGTEQMILNDVSFRIEVGKHYSIVGINGAGKTTITKLITGLYDNYEGTIYLNGKNLREYSQSELKSFYAVVYQDFAKYYIPFEDNIAIGHVNGLSSNDMSSRIHNAVETLELLETANNLPKGMKTPLGKIVEGGQDISGGEWQRIAMGRAFVNPAPIRILDEPTGALDPLSESRLYEEFEQISQHKTTIYISHRLGSTKLADVIFVIGDGRVIEQGSHAELMDSGGVYAQMYDSQRSWYDVKPS